MKTLIACLVWSMVASRAAIFEVSLGPKINILLESGSTPFSINAANVVPEIFAATGAGNETSGISYNDASKELDLHFGWGDAILPNGGDPFVSINLLERFESFSLRGPAAPGSNGPLLYSFD